MIGSRSLYLTCALKVLFIRKDPVVKPLALGGASSEEFCTDNPSHPEHLNLLEKGNHGQLL